MPEETVPTWNGEPSSFEAFATSCQWYVRGLKETERRLAASRVWQRLSGAAKSVVRHLDPVEFDKEGGLDKLLGILRASPLQQLPVPDSFGRLEKWNNLRRQPQETIPQLLVREEELFTELQQSLSRARRTGEEGFDGNRNLWTRTRTISVADEITAWQRGLHRGS